MPHITRISIIVLLLSFFQSEGVAQNKFTLSGIIPKEYDGIKVNLTSYNADFAKQSTNVKNGRFKLSGDIKSEYEFVILSVYKNEKRLCWWSFFINSGDMGIEVLKLEENNDKSNVRFRNIQFIDQQLAYEAFIRPAIDSHRVKFNLLRSIKKKNRIGLEIDSLEEVVKILKNQIVSQKVEFIRNNHTSYFSLYTLDSELISSGLTILNIELDTLLSLYSILDKPIKETQLGKSVETYLLKRKSLLINNILPDFNFTTFDGNQYRLSSFHKKNYILLCFWDSGCIPCIKSIPILKMLDSSYSKKGLKLISISIDNEKGEWIKSLSKYKMPWLQSCDLPSYIKGLSIRDLYDIQYIPQYFLIDMDGKLIYHNTQLNDDDEFSLLQNILANL